MITDGSVKQESEQGTHLSQLASVGQIAAGIAHEVKNPLTAVKGFLQLLEQDGRREYIQIAQSELDNALATLNNLLQVSKPDLENEDFQTIYLAVEIESILNLFQDKLYNIRLHTEFFHTNIPISGRKNQFKKAFFNLIKNAIESMVGIGTLTISHELVGNEVIVKIKDTGVGISADKIQLLGTPFFTTKEQGTGMGLTQVFSVVYQHGGNITVDSKENQGTMFTIKIPMMQQVKQKGVKTLNLHYKEKLSMKHFFFENRQAFEERLLHEAINVKDKIEEIHKIGNINLLSNAHKLVLFVLEERGHELISFAKQEGIAWAKYSLTLAFKLEWIQAIRRTVWDFLYNYDLLSKTEADRLAFYSLEKQINENIDQFLTYFFISYSNYKDELLATHQKMVDDLSVPIIPINREICILPLIGPIDSLRLAIIQDKVFSEIENHHIQSLIIDLSGITPMKHDATVQFIKLIEGISMMGCKTFLTGLRAEIVKNLISIDAGFKPMAKFKGTLEQALNDVINDTERKR
ncbi:ATP-binding protein [Neobacillus drentensis]|uniref:ATP-binding protein n=1 Tax=Neobacillus drentensis TaxID=220684 RepID=UPI001F476474|nr:ATP-binding protein [Neobacillus drentensis]ULT57916.1 ATP-binding protein [Neobacillus drentensis]